MIHLLKDTKNVRWCKEECPETQTLTPSRTHMNSWRLLSACVRVRIFSRYFRATADDWDKIIWIDFLFLALQMKVWMLQLIGSELLIRCLLLGVCVCWSVKVWVCTDTYSSSVLTEAGNLPSGLEKWKHETSSTIWVLECLENWQRRNPLDKHLKASCCRDLSACLRFESAPKST